MRMGEMLQVFFSSGEEVTRDYVESPEAMDETTRRCLLGDWIGCPAIPYTLLPPSHIWTACNTALLVQK